MGGAACVKIILNGRGIEGIISGIVDTFASAAGDTIPADLREEGEAILCEDLHKRLQEYEEKLLKATGYKSV